MKIVIIGGTGLIGKKLAILLRQGGHEVVAASPSTGAAGHLGVIGRLPRAMHGLLRRTSGFLRVARSPGRVAGEILRGTGKFVD